MNINVLTIFSPLQRQKLKEKFGEEKRINQLMDKMGEKIMREAASCNYKAKMVMHPSVMKRP